MTSLRSIKRNLLRANRFSQLCQVRKNLSKDANQYLNIFRERFKRESKTVLKSDVTAINRLLKQGAEELNSMKYYLEMAKKSKEALQQPGKL
jgi:hypothetical protein